MDRETTRAPGRFDFFRQTARPVVWLTVVGAWSLFSNAQALAELFVPEATRRTWMEQLPDLSVRDWIIGLLVLAVVGLFEGSFQRVRVLTSERDSTRVEFKGYRAEIESARPEIRVREESKSALREDQLYLAVTNSGGAVGEFSAQIQTLTWSNRIRAGQRLVGIWNGTETAVRIKPGVTAELHLAALQKGGSTHMISRTIALTTDQNSVADLLPYTSTTYVLAPSGPTIPPDVRVRVTINSDPPMKEPWIAEYRIDAMSGLERL